MKKLTMVLLALAGLSALSGCVAYVPYDQGRHFYHGGPGAGYGDRDGDGMRDRHDRRPNNPYRY
ncbi:hypothetical protein [Polaromonas jejuensis]|uniref:Lipoprotein n=1 Tax=Polaromonas jejuensis TaxID=457502 RepID=A0ABW0QC88_9BURK|nr:hypothetical protein [Polaromonas jejuensis]